MKKQLFVLGVPVAVMLMAASGGVRGLQRGPRGIRPPENLSNIRANADFGRMPLYFIPNNGQLDNQVAYYVQGKDKTLYFTSEGISMVLSERPVTKGEPGDAISPQEAAEDRAKAGFDQRYGGRVERWVVKIKFVEANKDVKPIGKEQTDAVISYFKGKPKAWRTGLPTYSKIVYPNLWPGIDLEYCGTVNRLKYEFIVHPGADPSMIKLAYHGADHVSIDKGGRLNVSTPVGSVRDDVPVAYQQICGQRVAISLAYKLKTPADEIEQDDLSNRELRTDAPVFGFTVGVYDHSQTLVLDPAVFVYCGYVGGSFDDYGRGIAVDDSGNAYVTGSTGSSDFPVNVGPDPTQNGNSDAFVAKVKADGTGFIYCGYIGGSDYDGGNAIAVDVSGNAYVTGVTKSTEGTFPATLGPDLTFNDTSGNYDAFVAKVNASGTALVYCGYLGGASTDYGYGIAVDGSGNAYVTGHTYSIEATFPVAVGPDLTFNGAAGDWDAFAAKVNAAGTSLVYCGYIGGDHGDYGCGIAVDGSGNAYVTGDTGSSEATFPVTIGPDLTYSAMGEVFVAKVNASGTALVYCGYIGGGGSWGYGIAVDALGNAYVTGRVLGGSLPVSVGPDLTFNGGGLDAIVAKVNAAGTGLVYCGYIGGSSSDFGSGIAVDGSGSAYVTGFTTSSETTFPVTVGPDLTYNGSSNYGDAFVAKVNASGTALSYCGYIGGYSDDLGIGIAVDKWRNAYVTGYTYQGGLQVSVGPDLTFNGYKDAFVAKIYYHKQPVHKHTVGDFDGDGTAELAMTFWPSGVRIWDAGVWTQLTAATPSCMITANVDGNNDDEIIADLGSSGTWLWDGGSWTQLSDSSAQLIAAGDVDADGSDEVVGDFSPAGLWLWNAGAWTQLSGVDAEYITTADLDGVPGEEIIGDFGASGLWLWSGGAWTQLSGVNADGLDSGKAGGLGAGYLAGGFGPFGLWRWSGGAWVQLSGVNADQTITADVDADNDHEIVGGFGLAGMWVWDSGVWTQLSGMNAEDMIGADVDGDGDGEVAVDFGPQGLWLWDSGGWAQISGFDPENVLAGDADGDGDKEIIGDFGAMGFFLWNDGAWIQIA